MALDRHELVERVGQRARLLPESVEVGQGEGALLGLLVAREVARDVLQRLQPPGVEARQQRGRGRAVGGEVIAPAGRRRGQLAPGGVGVLERELAVEARAIGVPGGLRIADCGLRNRDGACRLGFLLVIS